MNVHTKCLPLRRCAGMNVLVMPDSCSAARVTASLLVQAINSATQARGHAVVGLATGSTPRQVYSDLVQQHKAGSLSFRNVTTYNLDEYYPISPLDARSYHAYMYRNLFNHLDIAPNHAHLLDGTVPEAFANEHAADYERWMDADGGIDIQLLGIGRNGHIGFNEPSTLSIAEAVRLRTRLVELHAITRRDAAQDFGGIEHVIPRALTMGTAAILAARSIVVLAFGVAKTEAVAQAIAGSVTPEIPGSLLQTVADKVTWVLDAQAAQGLK
jgi:glucosamine-6-phosphate deaminase